MIILKPLIHLSYHTIQIYYFAKSINYKEHLETKLLLK